MQKDTITTLASQNVDTSSPGRKDAGILLKVTNWNIAEIATSLGFEEPSHFNLFFKKHAGESPTGYRKTIK